MKTRLLILCALFLVACGRRNLNGQATLPPPAVATNTTAAIQIEIPTTAPEATATLEPTRLAEATQAVPSTLSPTLEPTATPPLPTLTPQGDLKGDEVDTLLSGLEAANTADEQEINNLPTP